MAVGDDRVIYRTPRVEINAGLLAKNAFVVEGEQWCFQGGSVLFKVTMRRNINETLFYKINFLAVGGFMFSLLDN